MGDVDLIPIDMDPNDLLDFYLEHDKEKTTPDTGLRESRLAGAGSVVWTALLRRCDGGDGLQVEGNDPGTDHFARDDQLDAAVLLAAFGGIV
jgi:hypothetical protein